MPATMNRNDLESVVNRFIDGWNGASDALPLFVQNVRLHSSHVGNAVGETQLFAQLRQGSSDVMKLRVDHSNVVIRANSGQAVATAYVHGGLYESNSKDATASFGGVLVLGIDTVADAGRVSEVRVQLRWAQGRVAQFSGWSLPVMDRQWKPGDSVSALMSELDAAWHRIPASDLILEDSEAIAETWYRYAWALDQADFGLFDEAFCEDVTAELTPMGQLNGKRNLLSTLKDFRMPRPWMMHHGAPINIEISADGQKATMLLGRIIPGQSHAPDGRRIFGAHYVIKLRREAGAWRMSQMDYVPGWIRPS